MKDLSDLTTTQFIARELELIETLRKVSTPDSVHVSAEKSGKLPEKIQERLQKAVVAEAKIMLKEIEQGLNTYLYGEYSHDQEPVLSESSGSNGSSQDSSDVA